MQKSKVGTLALGVFLASIVLSGCSAAPQVTVEEACEMWFDAIDNSDKLAGDMTVGETSSDIAERVAAWEEMAEAAESIAPSLAEADPLASGLFRVFAETADKSTKVAERVANGAVEELPDADAARETLLDAFYPIADVCVGGPS